MQKDKQSTHCMFILSNEQTNSVALSPRANYTDLATAICRRSWCQFLRIEGVTWAARWTPTAVFSVF
jgi:hypothetical protein